MNIMIFMKFKIVFFISVLALLSFFNTGVSSVTDINQVHTELELEVSEESDFEDEALHYTISTLQHPHPFSSRLFVRTKHSKLLNYEIFKPPKLIIS